MIDSKQPILVSEVARTVRAAGASVWDMQKLENAFVLRCEKQAFQFTVVLAPVTGEPVELPDPKKTPQFLVDNNLADLPAWLTGLAANQPRPG